MEYYIVYEYDDYDNVSVFDTLFRSYDDALEAVREIVEKAERGYMEIDTPERRKQADEPSGAPVGDIGSNDRTFWIRKVKNEFILVRQVDITQQNGNLLQHSRIRPGV